jgi:hypothetical protein
LEIDNPCRGVFEFAGERVFFDPTFGTLESSARQKYQDAAPIQILFFIVASIVICHVFL